MNTDHTQKIEAELFAEPLESNEFKIWMIG